MVIVFEMARNTLTTTTPANTHNGVRIINNNALAVKHIRELIRIKQAGLCWHCEEKIGDNHTIVSRGKSRRYYYHDYCAKNLKII
jgi:hypothetical protein